MILQGQPVHSDVYYVNVIEEKYENHFDENIASSVILSHLNYTSIFHPSVYQSICLSVYLSICLSVYLSSCLIRSLCLYVCLSIQSTAPVRLSACVCPSACPFICQSQSMTLSITHVHPEAYISV